MLDKSEVPSNERRMLQSVLGLPVDESSDEETDSDGDDDAGVDHGEEAKTSDEGSARTPPTGDDNAAVTARTAVDIASLPTEPSAVLRLREQQKKRAGKHGRAHSLGGY